MKTNKKNNYLWILLIFALCFNTLYAQNEKQTVNQYALNAIEQAVVKYRQQKSAKYGEYMVVTLKLINISPTSGEFIVSYIVSGNLASKDFQPTHYIRTNNELILVKADSSCNCDPGLYGFSRMTEDIKEEVSRHVTGKITIVYDSIKNRTDTLIRRVSLTGPLPEMILFYEKLKIDSRFCTGGDARPLLGREYLSDWKLSLSVAEKSAKPYWVKKINSAYDLKKIEEETKNSLQKILKENTDLPIEIRNQDLNKLIFKPIFMYGLDFGSNVFSDTSSIYPYIKPDMDYKQPYRVLIFKENHFWGQLYFGENGMRFNTTAGIDSRTIDLYENVMRQKPNTLFHIRGYFFGYGDIWYTKSDKIFLFFNSSESHEEADEFIHRYKTPEFMMKRYGRE